MQKSSPDAADLAACRSLMQGGSRSFFMASLLLPRRVHDPAAALYAFCRLADDAIDEGGCKTTALAELRDRLARAYAGTPADHAADRALAAIVAEHALPRTLPEALLEGFEWDSRGRRYEDLDALHDYAARVAGTVGAMMAVLMGVRSPEALARACDLGIAMQLTNIARDVGEDARAGRLYLPLAWMRQAGLDPEAWLQNPVFNPQIASVIRQLLGDADMLYARAGSGIAQLPLDCRPGIRSASLIYGAIGRDIAAHGYDSVTRRARVNGPRKIAYLAQSLAALLPVASKRRAPALAAASYLVEAASREIPCVATWRVTACRVTAWRFAPGRALDERIIWMCDLFERVDQERRQGLLFREKEAESFCDLPA